MTDTVIHYRPPDDEQIEAFARSVSEHMADHCNRESFRQHEIVRGLADFFKCVAAIEARRMNRAVSFLYVEK